VLLCDTNDVPADPGHAPALDSTIVNVAIATIGHALDVTAAASQWTITGYLLALVAAGCRAPRTLVQ